jgi:transcriptional regulator with XRE-family HTH domain
VAAGFRQQDIAARAGMSSTRYSAIERGELQPNPEDVAQIERILPPLPASVVTTHGGNADMAPIAISCASAKF